MHIWIEFFPYVSNCSHTSHKYTKLNKICKYRVFTVIKGKNRKKKMKTPMKISRSGVHQFPCTILLSPPLRDIKQRWEHHIFIINSKHIPFPSWNKTVNNLVYISSRSNTTTVLTSCLHNTRNQRQLKSKVSTMLA